VTQIYEFLESFLDGKEWVAGDAISIADFSLVSSISSLNVLISIPQKCPNLMAWLRRCESLPECEVNKRGVKEFAGLLRSKISKK
jgi:glutathione S-transferase